MSNVRAQIVIHLLTDGSVQVNGPINDKVLCFGLLEVAKITIANHKPAEQALVQPVSVPLPPGVNLG